MPGENQAGLVGGGGVDVDVDVDAGAGAGAGRACRPWGMRTYQPCWGPLASTESRRAWNENENQRRAFWILNLIQRAQLERSSGESRLYIADRLVWCPGGNVMQEWQWEWDNTGIKLDLRPGQINVPTRRKATCDDEGGRGGEMLSRIKDS